MNETIEREHWDEVARDAQSAIARARCLERPERFDMAALGRALGAALSLGRKLQVTYAPSRLPGMGPEAPRVEALHAVEALLREVLGVVPELIDLVLRSKGERSPSSAEASVARWRSLWASDALHAGLALAYGRLAAQGAGRKMT